MAAMGVGADAMAPGRTSRGDAKASQLAARRRLFGRAVAGSCATY
jgi:hypothetical protein